jgi:heme exporter protein D
MLPDLGTYATPVLASYAVTAVVLGAMVAASLARGRRVKRALAEAERRRAAAP